MSVINALFQEDENFGDYFDENVISEEVKIKHQKSKSYFIRSNLFNSLYDDII